MHVKAWAAIALAWLTISELPSPESRAGQSGQSALAFTSHFRKRKSRAADVSEERRLSESKAICAAACCASCLKFTWRRERAGPEVSLC